MATSHDLFPTDSAGLPMARATRMIELGDGDRFDLTIAPVANLIGDATVRMLAYNGSIPGPTLKVREGSEIVVNIENQGDLEATVHWHGLRLENRYDGTHQTQQPMGTGERYTAHVSFPDPGVYWYHPHIREDYGQEMGLYGNVLVEPNDPDYWPVVHREAVLTLDDILIEDGQTDPVMTAKLGEVIRFYLTNTANTRVFMVALPGARIKLVGADSGHVEHERFVDDVILAPSERAVIDVQFNRAGSIMLEHHTPDRVYPHESGMMFSFNVDPAETN